MKCPHCGQPVYGPADVTPFGPPTRDAQQTPDTEWLNRLIAQSIAKTEPCKLPEEKE